MLALNLTRDFSHVRQESGRFDRFITFFQIAFTVIRVIHLRTGQRLLVQKLIKTALKERNLVAVTTKSINPRISELDKPEEISEAIEGINYIIAGISGNVSRLENLLITYPKQKEWGLEKAVLLSQESLSELYDTLRLLKKAYPATQQTTSEEAKAAVARTSNTLRSLYAR